MQEFDIKEYLTRAGICRITELDTALIEAFGQNQGSRHIERMTQLFDQSEERLVYGKGDTPYLHRQEELVDYLNQSLEMSILAASFYDRVFFRRVMEYLLRYDTYWTGDIVDIGCGNGILTCFLALQRPGSVITGLELSGNAVAVAEALAKKLQVNNVHFTSQVMSVQGQCDSLFSCRTAHENVAWKALCEEPAPAMLPIEEQARRHRDYAGKLAAMVRTGGYLVGVERYEDDSTYAGLVRALARAGLHQVRGTHMQFSCKNGDKTAVFQAMVFQKTEK